MAGKTFEKLLQNDEIPEPDSDFDDDIFKDLSEKVLKLPGFNAVVRHSEYKFK